MTLKKGSTYEGRVIRFSQSDNLVVREYSTDVEVVILIDEVKNVEKGDTVEFRITQTGGDHHVATPTGDKRIKKPEYTSSPNIPLHHDGKHGQSIGETRPDSFSFHSPSDYDPRTRGAPDISKSIDSYDIRYESDNKDNSQCLSDIANEVGKVTEFI